MKRRVNYNPHQRPWDLDIIPKLNDPDAARRILEALVRFQPPQSSGRGRRWRIHTPCLVLIVSGCRDTPFFGGSVTADDYGVQYIAGLVLVAIGLAIQVREWFHGA